MSLLGRRRYGLQRTLCRDIRDHHFHNPNVVYSPGNNHLGCFPPRSYHHANALHIS